MHHEDFMFIRETELLVLDNHITFIDELASKREMDWHTKATLSHKDEYLIAACWEQEGKIIMNVHVKKGGLSWRALVSRTSIS